MRRVRGMVTVRELVVIDDYAGSTFARDVGVAAGDVRFLVDVTEEKGNGLMDVIRPAECADYASLRQRISLPLHVVPDSRSLAGRGRPGGDVAPISVAVEQYIGVSQRPIPRLEVILDVSRSRRPVHQAVCLVGGVIEIVQANTSGNGAGNRLILLLGNVVGKRIDEAQARMVSAILVRPIGAAQEWDLLFDAVHDPRSSVVQVQGHGAAALDTARLPSALAQMSQHKTADVLDGVLLGSRHSKEFCQRFGGLGGLREVFDKLLPCGFPIGPRFRHPGISNCYLHRHFPFRGCCCGVAASRSNWYPM